MKSCRRTCWWHKKRSVIWCVVNLKAVYRAWVPEMWCNSIPNTITSPVPNPNPNSSLTLTADPIEIAILSIYRRLNTATMFAYNHAAQQGHRLIHQVSYLWPARTWSPHTGPIGYGYRPIPVLSTRSLFYSFITQHVQHSNTKCTI